MADNFFKVRNGLNIGPLSSAPANPEDGDIYYDTTLNALQVYQDGAWVGLSGGGGISGPGTSTDTAIATWNGTAGSALNSTGVTIDSDNNIRANNIYSGGTVTGTDTLAGGSVTVTGVISTTSGDITTAAGNISASGTVTGSQLLGGGSSLISPGLSFSSYSTLGFFGAGTNLNFVWDGKYYWYCGIDGVHYGGDGNTTNYSLVWDTDGGGSIGQPGTRPANIFLSSFANLAEISTPSSNPASGTHDLYFKSDDNLYMLNSSGIEVQVNVGVKNSSVWTKYTVSYSDLSASATTNTITLASPVENTVVTNVIVKHTTAFSGGSISDYQVQVTDGSSYDYSSIFDVYQSVSDSTYDSTIQSHPVGFTSGGTISLVATSTGDNLSAATTGSVEIWVQTSLLP